MYYLKIVNLSVREGDLPYSFYSENKIISGVTLNVSKGEILGILGPSGSGKTILLKTIAGLVKAFEGEIFKDNEDIIHLPPSKRKMAMVFQNIALYPHLKNIENIEFPYVLASNEKKFDEEKLKVISQMLHIDEKKILQKKPAFSSMGERQRVAIGKALASQPDVLLLDEPLSNIEDSLRNEIRHSLRKYIKKENITTLYVSHNQIELGVFADNIAVLAEGRIHQVASYEELYNNPKTLFVSLYIGEIPSNFLSKSEVERLSSGRISFPMTIRPDECLLEAIGDCLRVEGRVSVIEKLIARNKKLVMIDYSNKSIGIVLPLDYIIKEGENLVIYLPLDKAKFFESREDKIPERIYNLW